MLNALENARREMHTVVPKLQILKELASKVPNNANLAIEAGYQVLVYRKTDKRYLGPYPLTRVDFT